MKLLTPLGKAVYSAIFNPPRTDVSSMFLPKRMAFVYELEEGEATTDIPTTLRRSKEDCPKVRLQAPRHPVCRSPAVI